MTANLKECSFRTSLEIFVDKGINGREIRETDGDYRGRAWKARSLNYIEMTCTDWEEETCG